MSDLYRFFDANGDLLYVGISLSALQRASEHRSDKGWWRDVTRMEVEHHDVDRADLEFMEKEAIRNERPRHNKARSPHAEYHHRSRIARLIQQADDYNAANSDCFGRMERTRSYWGRGKP